MAYQHVFNSVADGMRVGDWTAITVKALVTREGTFRLYRCLPFVGDPDDAPQGERVSRDIEAAMAKCLFPATLYGMKPDEF